MVEARRHKPEAEPGRRQTVSDTIDLTLSGSDELVRLAEAVEAFGEAHALPPRTVMTLDLILEEIVANAIHHGAGPGRAHVSVVAQRDGDHVHGVVRDDGIAFDPLSVPAPNTEAPLEHRAVGGLGVHLVRTMADHVHYRREGGRNVLTFTLTIAKG